MTTYHERPRRILSRVSDPYLKTALKWFAVAGVAASIMYLGGCAPFIIGKGVCRHEALYAASVCAESYPARVAMGPPGHAQAQCYIGGKWEWIHRGDWGEVVISKQDNFSPERIEPLSTYVQTIKGSYQWKGCL